MLYSPGEPAGSSPSLYQQIVTAPDLQAIYSQTATQLAPATDDKPFFNQHMRWSQIRWSTIVDVFSQKGRNTRMSLEDRPVAEVTLLVLLVQSGIIAAVCILLPLIVFHRQPTLGEQPVGWLIYFAGLGLGYIMVEMALLQRFLLFLGQPIYTYAVVLAGLLIFTGVGSWAAGQESGPWRKGSLSQSLLAVLAVVIVTALITPPIFHFFLGSPLPVRIAVSLLLIAPLGFVMGMPFPLGLGRTTEQASSIGAWAWGVNGFFTVIGTVLALILGMMFGFRFVLLLAGLCYAGALLAVRRLASPVTSR